MCQQLQQMACFQECMVCSAPADGLHYGAISCRSCNAFFRRTVVEKAVSVLCLQHPLTKYTVQHRSFSPNRHKNYLSKHWRAYVNNHFAVFADPKSVLLTEDSDCAQSLQTEIVWRRINSRGSKFKWYHGKQLVSSYRSIGASTATIVSSTRMGDVRADRVDLASALKREWRFLVSCQRKRK